MDYANRICKNILGDRVSKNDMTVTDSYIEEFPLKKFMAKANKTYFFDPVFIEHGKCKKGKIVLSNKTSLADISLIRPDKYKVILVEMLGNKQKEKVAIIKNKLNVVKVLEAFFKRKDLEYKKLRLKQLGR